MKVTLNTNITKSNNNVLKQNNPNFTSCTPVFKFPEEKRLMPNWNGAWRRAVNYVCRFLNIATKEAPPNKGYQPSLWREISNFVNSKKLGNAGTWRSGETPLFHEIRAYTDHGENTIAQRLKELGVKFVQVGLD